ncbi:hypothetical protein OFN46_31140, partial [Escherichia coli]|nr:hypothetical protein [Escherichia coli]
ETSAVGIGIYKGEEMEGKLLKRISTIIFWIIPLLFFIHNLEESFQMPQYLANQFSITFITSQHFFIAISVLTLFVLVIIFLYQLNFLSS